MGQPQRVEFGGSLTDAVIVLTGSTTRTDSPYVLRVVDRDATGFSFVVDGWEYQTSLVSRNETISWVAVAAGVHELEDGRIIEAGTVLADQSSGSVAFSANFGAQSPVVVTSVMSSLDPTAVDSDPINVTSTGFDARIQMEEARSGGARSKELVGYIAFGVGGAVQKIDGVGHSGRYFTYSERFSAPVVVADTQTRNDSEAQTVMFWQAPGSTASYVFAQEDFSKDGERSRSASERVGFAGFEAGELLGTRTGDAAFVTQAELNAAANETPGETFSEIGQTGKLSVSASNFGKPIRVNFGSNVDNPIIALTGTVALGSPPYTLRVVDRDATGFSFMVEEWEYQTTSRFGSVTVNWVAVAAGTHTLSDGRVVEAGTMLADHESGSVNFAAQFDAAPVVLTSVMSSLDPNAVDSSPLNITTTGFDARLQQEEALQGPRAKELIGYIAFSVGGTVQAKTNVTHNNASVSFGETFTQGVVVADTQTLVESDTQSLMLRSQSSTGASIFVAEEQSDDSETFRTFGERVGVAAFEAGALQGNRTGDANLVTAAQFAAAEQAAQSLSTQVIGEAGSKTISVSSLNINNPIRVNYTGPIDNAVVSLTGSDAFGVRYSLRVVSSDANGFSFIVENWTNQFGFSLSNVNVQWVAIEAGVHELADGRIIEAGYVQATETSGSVSFAAGFTAPPVVVTTTMSQNNATPVDSDPLNITANGFDVRLDTANSYNATSRPAETVGYIAMSGGGSANTGVATSFNVFGTSFYNWSPPTGFTDMIAVADTQTQNSADKVDVKWKTFSSSRQFGLQTSTTSFPGSETIGVLAFSRGVIVGSSTN